MIRTSRISKRSAERKEQKIEVEHEEEEKIEDKHDEEEEKIEDKHDEEEEKIEEKHDEEEEKIEDKHDEKEEKIEDKHEEKKAEDKLEKPRKRRAKENEKEDQKPKAAKSSKAQQETGKSAEPEEKKAKKAEETDEEKKKKAEEKKKTLETEVGNVLTYEPGRHENESQIPCIHAIKKLYIFCRHQTYCKLIDRWNNSHHFAPTCKPTARTRLEKHFELWSKRTKNATKISFHRWQMPRGWSCWHCHVTSGVIFCSVRNIWNDLYLLIPIGQNNVCLWHVGKIVSSNQPRSYALRPPPILEVGKTRLPSIGPVWGALESEKITYKLINERSSYQSINPRLLSDEVAIQQLLHLSNQRRRSGHSEQTVWHWIPCGLAIWFIIIFCTHNLAGVAQANNQKGVSVGWAKHGGIEQAFESQQLFTSLLRITATTFEVVIHHIWHPNPFWYAKLGVRQVHRWVAKSSTQKVIYHLWGSMTGKDLFFNPKRS